MSRLGEVDRARAILQYGSQFSDPRRDAGYWKVFRSCLVYYILSYIHGLIHLYSTTCRKVWREFEEQHGNEDTFKDMLRVQRSVETSFSQVRVSCSNRFFLVDVCLTTVSTIQVNYLASEMIAGEQLSQQQVQVVSM